MQEFDSRKDVNQNTIDISEDDDSGTESNIRLMEAKVSQSFFKSLIIVVLGS